MSKEKTKKRESAIEDLAQYALLQFPFTKFNQLHRVLIENKTCTVKHRCFKSKKVRLSLI